MRAYILAVVALIAVGCKGIPIDTSMTALAAGDMTLMGSACQAMPGQGGDICRVVEGSQINETWKLVMPHNGRVESGEVRVRYKDTVRSYPVNGPIVEIPWKDIVGADIWDKEHDGLAQVTGTIRFKGNVKEDMFMDVLGIALLVVLQEGYTPLPIDSGLEAFKSKCEIVYSTAGRSAIKCK